MTQIKSDELLEKGLYDDSKEFAERLRPVMLNIAKNCDLTKDQGEKIAAILQPWISIELFLLTKVDEIMYKRLLKKYMALIDNEEGSFYVSAINRDIDCPVKFTEKEKLVLYEFAISEVEAKIF